MAQQKEYPRFSLAQRVEHWVMFVSFTLLAITGLPQKFADWSIADSIMGIFGGIEGTRNVHHIAAAVLAFGSAYHILVIAHKIFVLRVKWTMLPQLQDAWDGLGVIRYNLGMLKNHPKLPRFSFDEKVEYWAMVWGTLIMGLTGFMMWNPINTARLIPGDLIPAAKAAHGAEAILAVLAILVWHIYNVHLKTFNKTVFTGKLDRHQMEEGHGQELEEIERDTLAPRPSLDVIKKRERVFIPVAAVSAIVMVFAVVWLLSGEQTALATVPRRAQVKVFAPLPATPTKVVVATATPLPVAATSPSQPTTGTSVAVAGATATPSSSTATSPSQPAVAMGKDACLACHGPFDKLTALAPKYATDAGEKVNPHRYVPHDEKDAKAIQECSNCHKPHPLPPSATDIAAQSKTDVNWCYSACHHQNNFTTCKACHP
jgi:cytochrome b subunit of formate dehydrogenase